MCKSFKSHAWKENRKKKYFDDLFSVIFEIKEKYMCSLQKFTLVVGKYEWIFLHWQKGGCELYVSTKSISKANRFSKSNATRQRTISSLHRWGASTWPGLNDLPKVKQLTVSGLWHIPDLMNQMLAPETPTNSIILQNWEFQGMWGFAWG